MLSILIVNWNTREYLGACLRSVLECCKAVDIEIIVVDNASTDDSAGMVRSVFPDVRLLAEKQNLGFAAGNNLAYGCCRGDDIWLLNPDTQVLPGAPQAMLSALRGGEPRGAVASALIDARTGRPQRSCRTFPTPAALWVEAAGLARAYPRSRRFGFYRMGWWDYHDGREVEQPMASSLMVKREAIELAGGLFDEQFPIFFNDVDLCWRLTGGGHTIWYESQAHVLHHGGAATSQAKCAMISESHRSLGLFYKKHYRNVLSPLLYRATLGLISLTGAARTAACLLRQRRSGS